MDLSAPAFSKISAQIFGFIWEMCTSTASSIDFSHLPHVLHPRIHLSGIGLNKLNKMNLSEYEDTSEDNMARRRTKVDGSVDHSDAGVYSELQRLRSLVDMIEGEGSRKPSGVAGCFPLSLDNSMMSTIFGLVFVTIVTVTLYAFHNLYRAISKRFFQELDEAAL